MLRSDGIFPFPSQADLDARYVRRFVGSTLVADTYSESGTPVFNTQPGSLARIAWPSSNVDASLLSTGNAVMTVGGIVRAYRQGNQAFFTGIRFNGTWDAPTAVNSNQTIVNFEGSGHNGSSVVSGGFIRLIARTLWSAAQNPAEMLLSVVPLGQVNPVFVTYFGSDAVGTSYERNGQTTHYVRPQAGGSRDYRDDTDTSTLFSHGVGGLSFFAVPRTTRQLVPLGSTPDDIINALNNLGLFRLV